jgi:hypothetical protein
VDRMTETECYRQKFGQAIGAHWHSLRRTKAERSYEDTTVAKGENEYWAEDRFVGVGENHDARASIQEQKTSLKNAADHTS